MNLKSEKGAITLIVLVSFMFFIASVVCAQMYTGSKRASVDKEYKQVKANYEKDIENMDEIYNNLSQIDNLEVAFNDVSVNTQEKKISVSISTYILNLDIKTMKYGWLYSENAIANPNSQNITDWTFVEISEGTNKIIANKTYKETEADGFYYLCFMVNDKEFWMEDPITTGYINDGLILHLDAINNLGLGDSNHSTTTTTWKDLSGNGNDGTVYGAQINSNYLYFDGVDDYVRCEEIRDTNNSITFETTVMFKSFKSADIFSCFENGGFGIRTTGENKAQFMVYIEELSGYKSCSISETLNINTIYHIVGTYDGQNIKVYLNGKEKGTISIDGTIRNPNGTSPKLMIGIDTSSSGKPYGNNYAHMNVHSAKIYNRALTEDEIRQNYLMDKIRFNIEE